MSQKLSRLTNDDSPLAFDASVAINLLGTTRAQTILQALKRPCIIEVNAWREIRRDPSTGLPAEDVLHRLAVAGLLAREEMSAKAKEEFLELVLAQSPDGLDDGEAASVALANDIGASVVIDERKALRICAERLPALRVLSTMDLLCAQAVQEVLGERVLGDVVFAALQNARMRVPIEFSKWTVRILGPERAARCPSLNRYVQE